jgi:ribonucleoside-diphosphate reductase alpha chain
MRVLKRSGSYENVSFDKVLNRIKKLSDGLDGVHPDEVAQKICGRIYDGVTTTELDELTATTCSTMSTVHPDYGILAARIIISNLHKNTPAKFSEAVELLYNCKDVHGNEMPLVSDDLYNVVKNNKEKIDSKIDCERDYLFDFFGYKTLERAYLQKVNNKIIERPQYMWMRVCIGIHSHDLDSAFEMYDAMSLRLYTHATPTLFNAGTRHSQMSSCFVAGTPVLTTNRGPVPIEEVSIGDTVITHTGSVKSVLQTHKNPLNERSLFDIKVYKTPGFKVTGNHRFWSITKEQLNWKEKPQWNSIEQLRVGDWISIPKSNTKTSYQIIDMYDVLKDEKGLAHWTYSFEFDKNKMRRNTHFTSDYRPNGITLNGSWFERYITVDEKFAWFIGSWYGDGSIMFGRGSGKADRVSTHKGIAFAQNPNNTDFIEEIISIGEKYLGVTACVSKSKKQNCLSISFNNSAIGNAFNILFGRFSDGKRLWTAMYSWSREMVAALMGGIISTDGCCTTEGSLTLSLSNQSIMNSLFQLTRSVGFDTSLTLSNYQREEHYKKFARMNIPWIPEIIRWVKKYYDDSRLDKKERSNTTLEIDGNIFLRLNFKTKVTEDLPSYVYTLGIEDDHSYSVQGLIAENCFLLEAKGDSVDGMYDSIKDCATISKFAGGIGINVHKIRSRGSIIRGTNGKSTGTTPFLRVLNQTLLHINQAGKRNGSAAVYMDPSHPDVFEFVALRRNTGSEEERCRDLFIALWIPDIFMKRVKENSTWSLFCPFDAPGLEDVYGDEYEELYTKYEKEGKAKKTVKAQDLWFEILKSQIETGGPYMLYKDKCQLSNQSNLGVIKCSNLCSEILIYSSPKEYGVCNLASMVLPSFVDKDDNDKNYFNFEKFHETVKMVVRNMDKVIDRNFYPTPETRNSNMLHRPIGIGLQGLADTFMMLKYPYDSEESSKLNRDIAETMYHATLESSMEIAMKREELIHSMENPEEIMTPEEAMMTSYRGAYSSFATSPAAKGILQFDMHGVKPQMYDFDKLKEQIKKYGLRHSLLIALMPTASTSQIMGYTESFEALTSNIYQRRTLAGEFTVINKYLLRDLINLGIWNKEMKDRIIAGDGSIQHIKDIPEDIRNLYKTVWEISQKCLINQSADRTPYVCHTQSLNLYMEDATFTKLSNMHFYAWSKGLKTGLYYLRTRAKAKAMAFTLDPSLIKETQKAKEENNEEAVLACRRDNPEGCLMCSA